MPDRIRVTGIDLAGYMTTDAARAIAWYRDVLGLEPASLYPANRGAEYELADGTTFGLWGGLGDVVPFQAGNGILFSVADFDAALLALTDRGIPIVQQRDLPTCRMAMVADPDGNSVWLHQRKAG